MVRDWGDGCNFASRAHLAVSPKSRKTADGLRHYGPEHRHGYAATCRFAIRLHSLKKRLHAGPDKKIIQARRAKRWAVRTEEIR